MAKATKKVTDSTTKSTNVKKPVAKTKAVTKASDTTKSAARRPSEVQQKSAAEPKNNGRSSVAKKTTERAPEPQRSVERPAITASELETKPRSRKTPLRANGPVAVTPSPEQIAQRAYFLFLERGGHHGCDVDDWLEAERQVASAHA